MRATSIEGNSSGWRGLTVKRRRRWRCLTKTGEVGVFRCMGLVEVSPVKERGERCAQCG
jgi:hypothetical protein